MLKGTDEGFYIINGRKSPVHCLKLTNYNAGRLSGIHYHNYIEILYGIDCKAKIWIDDNVYSFETGDICIINPRETHYVFSEEDFNTYYVIKFSPELLTQGGQINSEIKYLIPIMRRDKKLNPIIKNEIINDTVIGGIIESIFCEWDRKSVGYEFAVRGEIILLFWEIIKILTKENIADTYWENSYNNDSIIYSVIDYISENYLEVTEEEAAKQCNMSYAYFSRSFKKVMNKNFSQFLEEIKIDAAKRTLLTTDESITEVAFMLGYSSASHFIQNFKKIVGETPLSYKKKRIN